MTYELDAIFFDAGIDPQLGQTLTLPPGEGESLATAAGAAIVGAAIAGAAASIPEGQPTPSGWPAAVNVVPTAWNTATTPATYTLQPGDTLSGLAATYLGAAARWREIWDMQPQQYRWTHSPDRVFAGEVFKMPNEARDNFLKWKRRGSDPGQLPGDEPPPGEPSKLRKAAPWIAGGAAVALIAWGVSQG